VRYPQCELGLPPWVEKFLSDPEKVYSTVEDRMRLAIELSRLNFAKGTGGPFGAGIFDRKTKKLLAPGVNLVISTHCSIAHAEMMAIMIAQQLVGNYDLGGEGMPPYELVSSTEPCAMCLGAICWSGVRHLVCGARDEDARSIGFDEGPKLPEWEQSLEKRGISVMRNVCRDEASAVLHQYYENGGIIYTGRKGTIL
jgi:tRNA(Arg) A34 adenosine deaminase TadA